MSAIDELFEQLRAANRRAFMPFITAGDPDLDFTRLVLEECLRRGAALCEVGIPYSDPIADGPVIQASYTRALDRGTRLNDIFAAIRQLRERLDQPLVSMVSYGIVMRVGPEEYVRRAQAAGFNGAIIPDLPVEESSELAQLCRQRDFSLIQLLTPTTTEQRAVQIARTSSGFIYFVSVTGITGERTELPGNIRDRIAWLRGQTDLPICVGFGISDPEQARMLGEVADGIIVGSAIVKRLAADQPRQTIQRDIGDFVASMVSALK